MNAPPIGYRVFCPLCDVGIACTDRHLGKRIRCPKCEKEFRVPQMLAQPTAPPRPEPPPIEATRPGPPPVEAPPVEQGFYRVETMQRESSSSVGSGLAFRRRRAPGFWEAIWPPPSRLAIVAWITAIVFASTVALFLLVAFAHAATEGPSRDTVGMLFTAIIAPVFITLGLTVYAAPAAVAFVRHHRNLVPIIIVNIGLGWTTIGWVAAMAWSFSSDDSNDPRNRPRL